MVGFKFYLFTLTALMAMEMRCFGYTTPHVPDDDEILDLRPIMSQECGLLCKFQKMLKSMEYFVCTYARTQARARQRQLLQQQQLPQQIDESDHDDSLDAGPIDYDDTGNSLESEPKKNPPQDHEQDQENEEHEQEKEEEHEETTHEDEDD